MPQENSSFIVFDGIDGSGKGTMLELAADYLKSKGIPQERIVLTAEPTRGEVGKQIRELLSVQGSPEESSEELLKLYIEDRRQHSANILEPALDSGKVILCDRYKYSSVAYQHAQGIPLERILQLNLDFPVPNLVIILDLPVEQAMERVRDDFRRAKLEKFEQHGFLEKVRQNFLKMKDFFADENIYVVDASRQKQEVFDSIKALLDTLV